MSGESGKFGTIKVVDVVFLRKTVRAGFSRNRAFWVPARVTKVTPTQFCVGSRRFRKADGKELGGAYSFAYSLGDQVSFGKVVSDQSEDLAKFYADLDKVRDVQAAADFLMKVREGHPKLDELHVLAKQIEELSQ